MWLLHVYKLTLGDWAFQDGASKLWDHFPEHIYLQ